MPFSLRPFRRCRALVALSSILSHPRRLLLLLFSMAEQQPKQEEASQDPPFDPLSPSVPISYPIKNLEDLESRSYFDSFHYPFNIASVPLPSASAAALPPRRRILVCHDMQGGYVDDKWVQGGSNPDAYAIWHWYLMDVFVYFSHNLVTLPPPCWTNAAHTHGVKVLGTFITEWDEGRAVCNTLLSTEKSSQMYAERLAELAAALGFDGWLINMEVKLDLEQIANLKVFVNHLTQTMHSVVPGSLVIWYDSVTTDGVLDWQDQLNEKNKPFFDLCDGIFVNYTWKENYPKLSATVAGDRRFDVYMGIDVFGRNTYGGGQWNTNVALDLLKKDDISAAIFAPGWVYETKQGPNFQTAQNCWWGLIERSWGLLQSYPKVLPFYSHFDQGHGFHFSIKGLKVADYPWNNLSCQGFQPMLNYIDPIQSTMQVFVNFKDTPYSGGANITCKGSLRDNDYFSTRLFQGKLRFELLPVHISYSVKSDGNSGMGLCLEFYSVTDGRTHIIVADDVQGFHPADLLTNKYDKIITPLVNTSKIEVLAEAPWTLHESSITMSGYTLIDISIYCYMKNPDCNGPETKKETPILEDGTADIGRHFHYCASLGHISIQTRENNINFPPPNLWITYGQFISWTLGSDGAKAVSLKIIWKLKVDCTASFMKYIIFIEKLAEQASEDACGSAAVGKEYLGIARVEAFYVSDLEVPPGVVTLRFIIQVCGSDGSCQELDKSPEFLLPVEGYQA